MEFDILNHTTRAAEIFEELGTTCYLEWTQEALVDFDRELIKRRNGIMIESVAYEIFKRDGIQEGIQEGIQQGELKAFREVVANALEERFGLSSIRLTDKIEKIDGVAMLKGLHRQAIRCDSLDEFRKILEEAM